MRINYEGQIEKTFLEKLFATYILYAYDAKADIFQMNLSFFETCH